MVVPPKILGYPQIFPKRYKSRWDPLQMGYLGNPKVNHPPPITPGPPKMNPEDPKTPRGDPSQTTLPPTGGPSKTAAPHQKPPSS